MFTKKWSARSRFSEHREHEELSKSIKRAAPRGTGGAVLAVSFSRAATLASPSGKTMEEMTVPQDLDISNDVRAMDADGVARAEIARRLHVSRNTVAKYADMGTRRRPRRCPGDGQGSRDMG